jgi:hypothetical protein
MTPHVSNHLVFRASIATSVFVEKIEAADQPAATAPAL